MEKQVTRAASVQYWNGNAKWYALWAEHNRYHDATIEVLTSLVRPGWRVLDIGAACGILSLHCAEMGCQVTALEPSPVMRRLLERRMVTQGIDSIVICPSRWEDLSLREAYDHDLIMASNSLHLTGAGFPSALKKVFLAKPRHVFIISEKQFLRVSPHRIRTGYALFFELRHTVESSYVYHCLDDVFEHWAFQQGRQPNDAERIAILSSLSYDGRHLRWKGSADVCLYWWMRKNAVQDSNIISKEVRHVYQNSALPAACHDFSSIC